MAPTIRTGLFPALNKLLREWEPADGPTGFEGLVATALATVTGLTFRLAKSGAQFGRDAASAPATFAIAMEAKRYRDPLRLETLAGKATVAAHALSGKIDLWIVAATSEIGDDTLLKLHEILEAKGISLLALDWSEQSFPRLAVLLATARDDVVAWTGRTGSAAMAHTMADALDEVAVSAQFEPRRDELMRDIGAAEIGTGALRVRNEAWAQQAFAERKLARRLFNQHLAPRDPERVAVARPALLNAITAAVAATPLGGVVALLGDEGCGKSWASAEWWLAHDPRPVLILAAGRAVEALDGTSEPEEMLAKLLARQGGKGGNLEEIARWRRKLVNWKGGGGAGRFCVVLDGLNERPNMPWADIVAALSPVVAELGGVMIVTCRPGFWRRSVVPRLEYAFVVTEVPVTTFSDEELSDALARAGIRSDTLPDALRTFLRNPRICDLALALLPQLEGVEQLSVGRLLAAYWQQRLIERGDLVGHEPRDFDALLRSHAAALRGAPAMRFDRDDWATHSTAARRDGPDRVRADLSDIEEGRFMVPDADGHYRFREEALPFAMGMLLTDELRNGSAKTMLEARELVERIVGPIQGFDEAADIVAAAVSIACRDAAFPAALREALILAYSGLQNRSEAAFAEIAAHVSLQPEAFLDALETADREPDEDDADLLALVLIARDHPDVGRALTTRLPQWLGTWSRATRRPLGSGDDEAERQARRGASIDEKFAALTAEERGFFADLCTERSDASVLPAIAARLIMGTEQAPFASGLIAYALAGAIAGDPYRDGRELYWAVRLNRSDHASVVQDVRAKLAPLLRAPSPPFAQAASNVLRMLGSRPEAVDAQTIHPVQPQQGWRRVELFCDADPLDPQAGPPTNLSKATSLAASFDPAKAWCSFSTGTEDMDLETITLGLARFEPDTIVDLLRRVVATAPARSGMPLRQLGWHLPGLSPMFGPDTIVAVRAAMDALIADPARATDNDFGFIVTQFAASLLPHLDAEAQLDLMLGLPEEVKLFWALRRYFKALDPEAVERRMITASAASSRVLQWTLFFLTAASPSLSAATRDVLAIALAAADTTTSSLATEVIAAANDADADEVLLAALPLLLDDPEVTGREQLWAWTATIIARRGRADLLRYVRPCHLAYVAGLLGGEALDMLADGIDAALSSSLRSSTEPPRASFLSIEAGESPGSTMKTIEELAEPTADPLKSFFDRAGEEPGDFEKKQAAMHREMDAFQAGLAREGLTLLAEAPDLRAIDLLVKRYPARVEGWLLQMLGEQRPSRLRQFATMALTLASGMARHDPELASRVFLAFRDIGSWIGVTVSRAGIPFPLVALFAAADSAEIETLREHLFRRCANDKELEAATLAAEHAGRGVWLDDYVERLAASVSPGDVALALTIAGCRDRNDRSDALLAQDWGPDFLGYVASAARRTYERNIWARHWVERGDDANSGEDYWRYTELAIAAADRRAGLWRDPAHELDLMRIHGGERAIQMTKKADKKTKKREDLLFGLKPGPDRSLAPFLLP